MALGNTALEWYDDDAAVWKKVTDHNRAAVAVGYDRIETKQRMVTGTLRRYSVAKKRTWTTSWTMLPNRNDVANFPGTVDGGMAGAEMEAFYYREDGSFSMRVRNAEGTLVETVTVMMTDFDKSIVKRSAGGMEFWELSVTLEEV